MFNEILSDKLTVSKDSIEGVRNLVMDDINKKIISESVIRSVIEYE